MAEVERLRQLAQAAADAPMGSTERVLAWQAFEDAAHPDDALALLDRLAAAEAKVARVEALEPTWHRGMYGCPDDMFSRRDIVAALTGTDQ